MLDVPGGLRTLEAGGRGAVVVSAKVVRMQRGLKTTVCWIADLAQCQNHHLRGPGPGGIVLDFATPGELFNQRDWLSPCSQLGFAR